MENLVLGITITVMVLMAAVTRDCRGSYRAELAHGMQVSDISRVGIDTSPDVPVTIEIKPLENIYIDIESIPGFAGHGSTPSSGCKTRASEERDAF